MSMFRPASLMAEPSLAGGTRSSSSLPASDSRRRLLVALGALTALAACGKKGDLELPPREVETEGGETR